ncbi:hypothetical protein [Gemmiger sp. An194]|uniref:hypothetical protein n=1 Tax=Gemmiger sp. An194 TaxID=1965582 RepID=UPI000B3A6861|nr:hypothetical protein [Gemmiger sp. An194]OUP21322.1 hypothetical protein B5F28_14100 [Gemmiger sp. An194]
MTKYICKCGRVVAKSTSADNTGNRDTENCKGCPYLLPWGPTQWDATRHAMVTDVKGYECRMSPSLDYATYYQGGGEDKCVLHIYSLDYDFLDQVTTWAAKQFPDKEISCSFDRSKIRAAEFVGGLYGMSVYPMQNKKGMAAKAALIERFFGPDGHRLDKTPEEEKAHVLAAIEAGKAMAQERKENMDYIISKHEATGRLYAYYKGSFWFWDSHIQRWLLSQFAEDLYQEERPKRWNFEREHFLAQTSDFHQLDDYEVPSYCIEALLQCNPKTAERENPTDAAEDAQQCALTASDAPTLPSPSANADAQQGVGDDSENPTYSAVATAAAEETVAAPEPSDLASMTAAPVAKTSAAKTGADENILVGSGGLTAFDFSALGDLAEQAAEADEQFNLHYGRAQDEYLVSCIYLARIHELTAKAGRYGGGTWTAWYQSKGISEGSARTMVQNGDGFKSASVADLKNLPVLTKKDLNLIARNGVANQVVEAAGEGDSDRIQDILNQLKAVQTERDEARKAKEKAEQERDAARDAQANLSAMANKFSKQRDAAEQRVEDAERRAQAAEEDAAGWKQAGLEMQELVDQRDERIRELESGITVEAAAVDQEEIERRANELSEPLVKIIDQQNEQIERMASGNTVSAQASVLEQYLRTMQTSLLGNARRVELACYDVRALDSLAEALREFADEIDGLFEDRSEDND